MQPPRWAIFSGDKKLLYSQALKRGVLGALWDLKECGWCLVSKQEERFETESKTQNTAEGL